MLGFVEFCVPITVWNIVNKQTQQEWKFLSFYPSNRGPNEDKNQNYIISWTMKIKKEANAEYEIIIYLLYMDDLTAW